MQVNLPMMSNCVHSKNNFKWSLAIVVIVHNDMQVIDIFLKRQLKDNVYVHMVFSWDLNKCFNMFVSLLWCLRKLIHCEGENAINYITTCG